MAKNIQTMTPMLCAVFLRVEPSQGDESLDSKVYRIYRRILVALLRQRGYELQPLPFPLSVPQAGR